MTLKLQSKIIFRCQRGPRPNTDFISTLGPDTLTDRGTVKVQPTLQLLHYPTIYAAGDVIDWNEQKQAVKGYWHAAVVVANILPGRRPWLGTKGALK